MARTELLANGTTQVVTGAGVCYCTLCRELYSSVTAFDRHIIRKGGNVRHDNSRLVRNSRGHFVTKLRDGETIPNTTAAPPM